MSLQRGFQSRETWSEASGSTLCSACRSTVAPLVLSCIALEKEFCERIHCDAYTSFVSSSLCCVMCKLLLLVCRREYAKRKSVPEDLERLDRDLARTSDSTKVLLCQKGFRPKSSTGVQYIITRINVQVVYRFSPNSTQSIVICRLMLFALPGKQLYHSSRQYKLVAPANAKSGSPIVEYGTPLTSRLVGDRKYIRLKEWLYNDPARLQCPSTHEGDASPGGSRACVVLPRRLLFVSVSPEFTTLRLVSTSSIPTSQFSEPCLHAIRYIALSHRWGKSRGHVTTKATLESYYNQVPYEDLPSKYRDAIELGDLMLPAYGSMRCV